MEKKKRRSLEEILDSLKEAEKEFDEKLDKYGLKEVKKDKPEEDEITQDNESVQDNPASDIDQSTDNSQNS